MSRMERASTTEKTLNFLLGEVLREKHPLWRNAIGVEQTRVIEGAPGKQIDILVASPGSSPVVIETEFSPAATVEADAVGRLGEVLARDHRAIEHAIALRIPGRLRNVGQGELRHALEEATFDYCVFSALETGSNARWPKSGWLHGSVDDVANCVESVALSETLISKSTEVLERGVEQAANLLANASEGVQQRIAGKLCQSPGEQTNRMAAAIIANALVFHGRIEGQQGIALVSDLKTATGLTKHNVTRCWSWIMENVNYWPIFKIASDLLNNMPDREANQLLDRLYETASELVWIGATGLNDLSGRMFQKLIADRKFLATFYTLPVSATLLAELAVSRLSTDWGNPEEIRSLRVADFACGTGTLIGALYHAVLSRYRRKGNDDSEIHSAMIEGSLYAFDIMPAATHLAASTLSNVHPGVTFGTTKIVTMPYGSDGRESKIGSLDLIADESTKSLFTRGRQKLTGKIEVEVDPVIDVLHGSLDVIIMNPPFTRPTNHESDKMDIPIPSFAGLDTSEEEQKIMSRRLKQMRAKLSQPAGDGNAGLASDFIDLADAKLKPGGTLALVLPATFVQGEAWRRARKLLVDRYFDATIVSIADFGDERRAFSADTSMAEVLVVATKKDEEDKEERSGVFQFVNLRSRPLHHLEALEVAKFVSHADRRRLGARAVTISESDSNGNYVNTEQFLPGCMGLSEANLITFMVSFEKGRLLAVRQGKAVPFPVARLHDLGTRGLLHRDLVEPPSRGPFDKVPLTAGRVPTYPALWNHSASRERRLVVDADCELLPREGSEERTADAWSRTASRLHLNLDFRINSLSLAACLTPEKTLGGRAWPNFVLDEPKYEKILLLWFNSTLGLMTYWWTGSRQHPGRTIMTITALSSLLSIDPRQLDETHLERANALFDQFSNLPFLPANESYRDSGRKALDEGLLVSLLGVPMDFMEDFDIIRRQWCAEPSVHGGKSTRP